MSMLLSCVVDLSFLDCVSWLSLFSYICYHFLWVYSFFCFFFFSIRSRHTSCALVTGVQTCALPILTAGSLLTRIFCPFLTSFMPRVAIECNSCWSALAGRLKWVGHDTCCLPRPAARPRSRTRQRLEAAVARGRARDRKSGV